MAPLFARSEYADRLERVSIVMQIRKIDVLVIGDLANIKWLRAMMLGSFIRHKFWL